MEEALCRAAGILEQVFTRAGCTRYLHTFGSSGTEPIVRTSIHGVVPRARERYEKKGERLKIHRSGTSFPLEMLILVRRSIESLGESVIEIFLPRENLGTMSILLYHKYKCMNIPYNIK